MWCEIKSFVVSSFFWNQLSIENIKAAVDQQSQNVCQSASIQKASIQSYLKKSVLDPELVKQTQNQIEVLIRTRPYVYVEDPNMSHFDVVTRLLMTIFMKKSMENFSSNVVFEKKYRAILEFKEVFDEKNPAEVAFLSSLLRAIVDGKNHNVTKIDTNSYKYLIFENFSSLFKSTENSKKLSVFLLNSLATSYLFRTKDAFSKYLEQLFFYFKDQQKRVYNDIAELYVDITSKGKLDGKSLKKCINGLFSPDNMEVIDDNVYLYDLLQDAEASALIRRIQTIHKNIIEIDKSTQHTQSNDLLKKDLCINLALMLLSLDGSSVLKDKRFGILRNCAIYQNTRSNTPDKSYNTLIYTTNLFLNDEDEDKFKTCLENFSTSTLAGINELEVHIDREKTCFEKRVAEIMSRCSHINALSIYVYCPLSKEQKAKIQKLLKNYSNILTAIKIHSDNPNIVWSTGFSIKNFEKLESFSVSGLTDLPIKNLFFFMKSAIKLPKLVHVDFSENRLYIDHSDVSDLTAIDDVLKNNVTATSKTKRGLKALKFKDENILNIVKELKITHLDDIAFSCTINAYKEDMFVSLMSILNMEGSTVHIKDSDILLKVLYSYMRDLNTSEKNLVRLLKGKKLVVHVLDPSFKVSEECLKLCLNFMKSSDILKFVIDSDKADPCINKRFDIDITDKVKKDFEFLTEISKNSRLEFPLHLDNTINVSMNWQDLDVLQDDFSNLYLIKIALEISADISLDAENLINYIDSSSASTSIKSIKLLLQKQELTIGSKDDLEKIRNALSTMFLDIAIDGKSKRFEILEDFNVILHKNISLAYPFSIEESASLVLKGKVKPSLDSSGRLSIDDENLVITKFFRSSVTISADQNVSIEDLLVLIKQRRVHRSKESKPFFINKIQVSNSNIEELPEKHLIKKTTFKDTLDAVNDKLLTFFIRDENYSHTQFIDINLATLFKKEAEIDQTTPDFSYNIYTDQITFDFDHKDIIMPMLNTCKMHLNTSRNDKIGIDTVRDLLDNPQGSDNKSITLKDPDSLILKDLTDVRFLMEKIYCGSVNILKNTVDLNTPLYIYLNSIITSGNIVDNLDIIKKINFTDTANFDLNVASSSEFEIDVVFSTKKGDEIDLLALIRAKSRLENQKLIFVSRIDDTNSKCSNEDILNLINAFANISHSNFIGVKLDIFSNNLIVNDMKQLKNISGLLAKNNNSTVCNHILVRN